MQTKLTMQNLHNHQPKTRESQINRAPKRAKTTKEHNRNQSKKQSSENSITISASKNATSAQKTKEQRETSEKNYSERKKQSEQTAKAAKGTIKPKQCSEAGQASPKQVANRATIFFRFQFLKKNESIRILNKKIATFLLVEKIGGIPPTAHSLDLAKRMNESGAQKLCA